MSEQTTEQTVADAPQSQLQLSDILLAAQVIQLASKRGAFSAEEFTQVGGCYERLVSFLRDSGALQTQASSAPTSESVEQSATE